MNFEFQKLTLSQAVQSQTDALIVLWPSATVPQALAHDPVNRWLATALEQGDFELKAGSLLSLYSQSGIAPRHLVVACTGNNLSGQIRAAVQAAWNVIKAAKIKRVSLHVAGQATQQGLLGALSSLAEASYSYTATLSKPKPRTLTHVQVSCAQASTALTDAVVHAQALVAGVELAKEWANRPANHATPTHLAQAAQKLASGRAIKCEVLGPKEVAKLGMGAFLAVAQGAAEPLRFIVLRYSGAAAAQAPVVLVG